MNIKIVSVIAAVAFLAACETAPTDTTGAAGTGAAAAGAAMSPAAELVSIGDRVFFDFNKSNVREDAQRTLQAQAAWLKKFPQVAVVVEGHCDERGTREYNLGLGERRANAVKDYLVALGIQPNRVKTISYGKERPVALGHNEAAWSQNRRGVTVIAQ